MKKRLSFLITSILAVMITSLAFAVPEETFTPTNTATPIPTPDILWHETFNYSDDNPVSSPGNQPPGWYDETNDATLDVELTYETQDGLVAATTQNGATWGKALSFSQNVDLTRYPKVEVTIDTIVSGSAKIMLFSTDGGWQAYYSPSYTSPGIYEIDIAALTGWSGVKYMGIGLLAEGSGSQVLFDSVKISNGVVIQPTMTPTPTASSTPDYSGWDETFNYSDDNPVNEPGIQPPGWQDRSDDSNLRSDFYYDQRDGYACLTQTSHLYQGKTLSTTQMVNVTGNPFLTVAVDQLTGGAMNVILFSRENGWEEHNQWIYSAGVHTINIPTLTGWSGNKDMGVGIVCSSRDVKIVLDRITVSSLIPDPPLPTATPTTTPTITPTFTITPTYQVADWTLVGNTLNSDPAIGAEWHHVGTDGSSPYITFIENNPLGGHDIYCKHYNGQSWSQIGNELIENSDAWYPVVSAFNGLPYVAYQNRVSGHLGLYVKQFVNSQWQNIGSVVSATSGQAVFGRMSLNVYNNIPYVTWVEKSVNPGPVNIELYAAYYNGTSWQKLGSNVKNSSLSYVESPELLITTTGTIYVAYACKDGINDQKVYVTKYENGNWIQIGEGFKIQSDGLVMYPKVILHNDQLHVCWNEYNYNSFYKIQVAKFENNTWTQVGSSVATTLSDHVTDADIVSHQGDLYVSYSDDSSGAWRSMLSKWENNSWVSQGAMNKALFQDVRHGKFVSSQLGLYYAWLEKESGIEQLVVSRKNNSGFTYTATPTPTMTSTSTITSTATITQTPTVTPTPTITLTPTSTPEHNWIMIGQSGLFRKETNSRIQETKIIMYQNYPSVLWTDNRSEQNGGSLVWGNLLRAYNGTEWGAIETVKTIGIGSLCSTVSYSNNNAIYTESQWGVMQGHQFNISTHPGEIIFSDYRYIASSAASGINWNNYAYDFRNGYVMEYNGSQWSALGDAFSGWPEKENFILGFAQDNTVYLAYVDLLDNNKLKVHVWNGSQWTQCGGALNRETGLKPTSCSFANYNNTMYITWIEYDQTLSAGKLYVSHWDGTQWIENGTDISIEQLAEKPKLTITSRGVPYVIWKENNGIFVKNYDGNNWIAHGGAFNVEGTSRVGNLPSIVSHNGYVYASWAEDVKYSLERHIFVKKLDLGYHVTATMTPTATHSSTATVTATPITNAWLETFDGSAGQKVSGWEDESDNNAFNANLNYSYNEGDVAALTRTADSSWGKALSPLITCDVDQYDQLEIKIDAVSGGSWKVGIQEMEGSYQYWDLCSSQFGTGLYMFDLGSTTGWTGTHTFKVQLVMEGPAGASVEVDHVRVCLENSVMAATGHNVGVVNYLKNAIKSVLGSEDNSVQAAGVPEGTVTVTPTLTASATDTPDYSPTVTPTITPTPTQTPTTTASPTVTVTSTATIIPEVPWLDHFENGTTGIQPSGWLDATNNIHPSASIKYATTNSLAEVEVLTSGGYGAVQSVLHSIDLDYNTQLEIDVDQNNGSTIAVDVVDEQNTAYFCGRIYSAGMHRFDIRQATGKTGVHNIRIRLNVEAIQFTKAVVDSVRIYHADYTPTVTSTITPTSTISLTPTISATATVTSTSTPTVTETVTPTATEGSTSTWQDHFIGTSGQKVTNWLDDRDDGTFNAELNYGATTSFARLSRTNDSTWGKTLTTNFVVDLGTDTTDDVIEIDIESLAANTTWKLSVQEMNGSYDYVNLQSSSSQTGVFSYNYGTLAGWTGVKEFKIELVVEGGASSYIDIDRISLTAGSASVATSTPSPTMTSTPIITATPTSTPDDDWDFIGEAYHFKCTDSSIQKSSRLVMYQNKPTILWEEDRSHYWGAGVASRSFNGTSWDSIQSVKNYSNARGYNSAFFGNNTALLVESYWGGSRWDYYSISKHPGGTVSYNETYPRYDGSGIGWNNNVYDYRSGHIREHNGSGWSNLGGVIGQGNSISTIRLAFGQDNSIAMSYIDNTQGNKLLVWFWNGEHWIQAGSALNRNSSSSVTHAAITNYQNQFYISWVEAGHLYVAKWNGSQWENVGSDLSYFDSVAETDITVTALGVPYVIWRENSKIYVKYFDSGNWVAEGYVLNLVPNEWSARKPWIVSHNGVIYVSWTEVNPSNRNHTYVKKLELGYQVTATPTITATATVTPTLTITETPSPDDFWKDHFSGIAGNQPQGWFDESDDNNHNAELVYSHNDTHSYAYVSLTAGATWGKVISTSKTCQVNNYPALELFISRLSLNTTWKVGIQEVEGSWRYWDLCSSRNSDGYQLFDYAQLTGLTGTSHFAVVLIVEGAGGSWMELDYIRLTTDAVFSIPTRTPTPTQTSTVTPTLTVTLTGTRTMTPTYTMTPTISVTSTITTTNTITPTITVTSTITPISQTMAWHDEFWYSDDSPSSNPGDQPPGWYDVTQDPAMGGELTYSTTNGIATLTGEYSKALSSVTTVNLNTTPYVVIHVSELNSGYGGIGVFRQSPQWDEKYIMFSQPGTYTLDIPAETQWSGTVEMGVYVLIGLANSGNANATMDVDYIRIQNVVQGAAGSNVVSSNKICPGHTQTCTLTSTMTETGTPTVTATPTNTEVPEIATYTPTHTPTITITATPFVEEKEVVTYPNPARNRVSFAYTVTGDVTVTLDLYKITGERIAHITESKSGGAGQTLRTVWDAVNVSPGIYISRIVIKEADGKIVMDQKKKIALIK